MKKGIKSILDSELSRGAKVKQAREFLGLSQREFAEQICGSSQNHVSRWETAEVEVSDLSWYKIVQYLNVL